eukprot:4477453-Ditylum_brightwellii.AAC.1
MPVTQEDTKKVLFGPSSSSDSSESYEKADGSKSGDSPKDPPSVDTVNACGDDHEEPHGNAYGHAGGGISQEPHDDDVGPNKEWKQMSTQATMKSVR